MKVRALTIGLSISPSDFFDDAMKCHVLEEKLLIASRQLNTIEKRLQEEEYEVQTKRISFNSFELWLPRKSDGSFDAHEVEECIKKLIACLKKAEIVFCNIGCATSKAGIEILEQILPMSESLNASALIQNDHHTPIVELAQAASRVVKFLSTWRPDGTANFRFCASFNCPPNIPFFPASYHDNEKPPTLTVGMECGDLLFLAFHGVTDLTQATQNLESTYFQLTQGLEKSLLEACQLCGMGSLRYGGIDASMNPGLTIQDSVGLGFEQLPPYHFGKWGTLAVVSTITRAIKALSGKVTLTGYNGLMLPVMEDLTLAERASETKEGFTLRDLLLYSSVCGVGLDTVPVPGSTKADDLFNIYMDIGSMAYRLNKPLSCRLLLMPGLKAGEMTNVDSPYLVNTRVFSIE